MSEWTIIRQELERPFEPEEIHWRPGYINKQKGQCLALAYVDARNVMERLDQVMGCDWQNRYTLDANGLLICEVGLKIDGEWRWRSNGAGDTQVEAEKGKASDAFKRAAVQWGVARYLYQLGNTWAPVEGNRIKTRPNLPDWATPKGWDKNQGRDLYSHMQAARENYDVVATVKDAIAAGDYPAAAAALHDLDEVVKYALWRAPSFGGIWTTREREIMQSSEFQNYTRNAA